MMILINELSNECILDICLIEKLVGKKSANQLFHFLSLIPWIKVDFVLDSLFEALWTISLGILFR